MSVTGEYEFDSGKGDIRPPTHKIRYNALFAYYLQYRNTQHHHHRHDHQDERETLMISESIGRTKVVWRISMYKMPVREGVICVDD